MKKTKRSDSLNDSLGVQSSEEKISKKKDVEDVEKNAQPQLPQEDEKNKIGEKKIGTRLETRNLSFYAFIKERALKRTSSENIWKRHIN